MTEEKTVKPVGLGSNSGEMLRQIVEGIEKLEDEMSDILAEISDRYKEAKGVGFDVKILRQIVRERKKAAEEREYEEEVKDLYRHALGMQLFDMGED